MRLVQANFRSRAQLLGHRQHRCELAHNLHDFKYESYSKPEAPHFRLSIGIAFTSFSTPNTFWKATRMVDERRYGLVKSNVKCWSCWTFQLTPALEQSWLCDIFNTNGAIEKQMNYCSFARQQSRTGYC